jgi:citrate lyase beta subunit
MGSTLSSALLAPILERLAEANREFDSRYAGDSTGRQPVHVVYGGAQRFAFDTAQKFGVLALETIRKYASDARTLAQVTGMDQRIAESIYPLVISKLEREPVEDFRIDFEDGYGSREDGEEDGHARSAAAEVARGLREGTLPPFIGLRIKALTTIPTPRAIRTLDLFLTTVLEESGGALPANFVVTLTKVTLAAQVAALDEILLAIEGRFGLSARSTAVELMIETPQALVNRAGVCQIPVWIEAAQGRCRGIHFGPYDYTSSLNITSADQSLAHPACDFARQHMLAAAAGTGVFISDGPTKLLPLPVHRGRQLTAGQQLDNREAVHRGMRAHSDDIRRALRDGIYQGWDLHPAQLPTRYAATYAFFIEGAPSAAKRLRNFLEDARQATLLGNLFDDAASGQGLLNFFLRGHACGALDENAVAATGLTMEDIRGRSFLRILEARRGSTD